MEDDVPFYMGDGCRFRILIFQGVKPVKGLIDSHLISDPLTIRMRQLASTQRRIPCG